MPTWLWAVFVVVCVPTAGWVGEQLLRRLIDQWFDRGMERFRIEAQAIQDMEVERLRNQLQVAAFEHQTRFARLHERRFRVLQQTYVRLVIAQRAFASWTAIFQMGGEPQMDEKAKLATEAGNRLIDYFEINRIWLPGDLCDEIAKFTQVLREVALDFSMRDAVGRDTWKKVSKVMSEDLPTLRRSIEMRCRLLIDPSVLGGESSTGL